MHVLMATGGSPHSEAALRFGAEMAGRIGAAPTILTVIRHERDRPRAEAILARAGQLLQARVPQARTKIRVGQPAEEIIREAEEEGYNLILIGERQHHHLMTRFLLGSTAERVVTHAPCPVIIAKGKIGPVRRILLCDSGAQSVSLFNRFVTQLGKLIEGEEAVTILHVMSQMSAGPGVIGRQLQASAEELIAEHAPEGQLLEQDIRLLERLNIHPQSKIRHGLVVDEILAEARSGDYDLVAIGAHRYEGWQNILLDDLARKIVAQVDRPILVIR
jgi:nucleotide-binding universal stress UspA family protein